VKIIYIAVFGLLGVFGRYYGQLLAARVLPPQLPFGTFLINMVGAFLIGVVYVLGLERQMVGPELRLGLMVGFLGGFTTFSSYCLEGVRLAEDASYLHAFLYLGLSPVFGVGATLVGLATARWLSTASVA